VHGSSRGRAWLQPCRLSHINFRLQPLRDCASRQLENRSRRHLEMPPPSSHSRIWAPLLCIYERAENVLAPKRSSHPMNPDSSPEISVLFLGQPWSLCQVTTITDERKGRRDNHGDECRLDAPSRIPNLQPCRVRVRRSTSLTRNLRSDGGILLSALGETAIRRLARRPPRFFL